MGVYDYTPEETQAITAAVTQITARIRAGKFRSRRWDKDLLRELHHELLGSVRPGGAGRIRSAHDGAEYLNFGPNRSVHRGAVEQHLDAIIRVAERERHEAINSQDVGSALRIAVWLHAEIIRVHPFFDGNGRTSRFMLNIALDAMGLGAIAVETIRKEYNTALNEYFAATPRKSPGHTALDPLVDLITEVYSWQAPE